MALRSFMLGPHPEEPRFCAASRRMAASPFAAAILRDARLRRAPQDEGQRTRKPSYANTPSPFAACQFRQKSCGIWMWVEPKNENASFTALENAGTPPTLGLSPTPLAPIG